MTRVAARARSCSTRSPERASRLTRVLPLHGGARYALCGGAEDAVKACKDVPAANYAVAEIAKDGDKGLFPLKMRDTAITESYNYLKKRDLFPDGDDDSEDDMVFGDEDPIY